MSSFASTLLNELSIAPNLAIAAFLGMLIGLERQWRQRYTGLTTHALVSLGAAAFTSLGMLIDGGTDVRMGGQVVTGIGFLGAGLIMRDGLSVRGLSGAATVWSTGAVGVLAGYGYLISAAEACAFVLLINLTMPRIGALIERHAPEKESVERYYMIELKCLAEEEAVVRSALLQAMETRKLRLRGLESHSASETGIVAVEAVVYTASEQNQLVEQVVGDLSLSPLVQSGKWTSTAAPE